MKGKHKYTTSNLATDSGNWDDILVNFKMYYLNMF